MSAKGVGSAVFVHSVASLIIVAAPSWNVMALELHLAQARPSEPAEPLPQMQLAQVVETGCRQTNAVTGVYTQPSLDSSSRGILTGGQTVRLELIGTGTGWARITEPVIGWVEAKYLTPSASCTGLGNASSSTTQIPGVFTPAQPSTQVAPSTQATPTRTVTVVCEVLPTEGLVVRSEPSIASNTALYTIPKGAHQFQFTNNHLTTRSGNLERQWAYITAPYQGWISLGGAGLGFNLGGRECG